jgi:hypothetical protein
MARVVMLIVLIILWSFPGVIRVLGLSRMIRVLFRRLRPKVGLLHW